MDSIPPLPPGRQDAASLQNHIKRLEREKASMQASVNAFKDERDHLRERMKVCVVH